MDWSLIQLTIPSKSINAKMVDFGSRTTQFKNLLKFAVRRKYGNGDSVSILVGTRGEIKNQTYLSRIIDDINNLSAQDRDELLERKDLFTFIGDGKYRLRILPEHISIDQNLLNEFTEQVDNQEYLSLM